MIIKDIHLQGIIFYKPMLEYEQNDLILYQDTLYIVTASYSGKEPPNEAAQCTPYTEYHSYDIDKPSDDENDNRIITASVLRKVINTMFRGLSLEGVISTLNTCDIDLDELKDTGAYHLIINNDLTLGSIPPIPSGFKVLLRVFKSATITIQEIIDYDMPVIYYRYYNGNVWSTWSFISNGDDTTVYQFKAALKQYQNKVSEYAKKIKQIEDHSRIYIKEVAEFNPPVSSVVVEVIKGSIIQVGVTYKEFDFQLQDWITIDLSMTDTGMAGSSNGSRIYYRITSGNITTGICELTLSTKYPNELQTTFPGNNSKIFKVLLLGRY
jgi:hypothetical protein